MYIAPSSPGKHNILEKRFAVGLLAASYHFQALFSPVLFVFCHIASYLLSFLCTHSVCYHSSAPILLSEGWMNEWMNEL